MMFYFILQIPSTVLKYKLFKNCIVWKFVNLLANLHLHLKTNILATEKIVIFNFSGFCLVEYAYIVIYL